MPLHVAPDAERLATPRERALEGLLPCVGMAVDAERAWSREGLVARLADIPVLALGEGCRGGGSNVMMVLPGVAGRRGEGHRHW